MRIGDRQSPGKKNETIKFVIDTKWLDGVVSRGVTTSGKLIRDT